MRRRRRKRPEEPVKPVTPLHVFDQREDWVTLLDYGDPVVISDGTDSRIAFVESFLFSGGVVADGLKWNEKGEPVGGLSWKNQSPERLVRPTIESLEAAERCMAIKRLAVVDWSKLSTRSLKRALRAAGVINRRKTRKGGVVNHDANPYAAVVIEFPI